LINEDVDLAGIIADLRTTIDQLNLDFIQAKRLIKELAKRLDELGKCEKSDISAKIKGILTNEIRGHKLTEKWIEECLPSEYKRKYTRKSELSSLSKKIENVKVHGGNAIDNGDGSTLLINHNTGHSDSYNNKGQNLATGTVGSKEFAWQECEKSIDGTDPYQILKEENSELREPLRRTKIIMGDQIGATEMEFKIPKVKYYEIKEAMTNSKYFCYLSFNSSGIMVRVVPDIFKTN
jgi:hypothetical protein